MRIATITKLSLGATLLLSVLAGVFVWRAQAYIAWQHQEVTEAEAAKQAALDLAAASDYLTDQVRQYAVTGRKEHLDKYWREVRETRTRERAVARLKELGAAPEELGLLEQARLASDALIRLEEVAMQAVADGNLDRARDAVYGADYSAGKARITGLIQAFHDKLTSREDAEVAAARSGTSTSMTMLEIVLALAMAGFAAILYFVFGRHTVRPLVEMQKVVSTLAKGDYTAEVPHTDRKDEIGDMAKAILVFKENGIANERMQAERAQAQAERERRQQQVDRLVGEFDRMIGEMVGSLSSSSAELEAAANTLASTAETTGKTSETVAETSRDVSSNVQSTAAATEEITASVNEISRQMHEASRIVQTAVAQAQKTDANISQLSQAATRIGDVVKLITAIAEQTNLLALNATIEAARAGEVGRGFAVVASEVKALASQTARATEEISGQIAGMQAATQESVAAIHEINGTINRMSEISSTIAAAVEEQGSATQEIARNVQHAAQLSGKVAENITEVSRGAGATGAASGQVLSSARMLSSDSTRLRTEVEKFLTGVRAA